MSIFSRRIREKEIVRTNYLGAQGRLAVGKVFESEGRNFLITRHKVVPTTPRATFIVYGRPTELLG